MYQSALIGKEITFTQNKNNPKETGDWIVGTVIDSYMGSDTQNFQGQYIHTVETWLFVRDVEGQLWHCKHDQIIEVER